MGNLHENVLCAFMLKKTQIHVFTSFSAFFYPPPPHYITMVDGLLASVDEVSVWLWTRT